MSHKAAAGLAIILVVVVCILSAIGLSTVYLVTRATPIAYPQAYHATWTASARQTSAASVPSPTRRAAATSTPRPPQYTLSLIAMRGHRSGGGNYFVVEGQVQNISNGPVKNVVAVATVYDSNHGFISYDEALIDYTTLLPQQVSPFTVMVDYNPSIEYYDLAFTSITGEPLAYQDNRLEATPDGAFLTCAQEVMTLMDEVAPTFEEQIDYALANPEAGQIICSFLPISGETFETAAERLEDCGSPNDPGLQRGRQAMGEYFASFRDALLQVAGYCGLSDPLPGGLQPAQTAMSDAESASGEAWGMLLSYESDH